MSDAKRTPLNVLAAIRKLALDDCYQKLMLMYFVSRADAKTWLLYPSKERIARETQLSLPTVKRTLRSLRDLGFVSWKPGHRGVANMYTLHIDHIFGQSAQQRESEGSGSGVDDLDSVVDQIDSQDASPCEANSEGGRGLVDPTSALSAKCLQRTANSSDQESAKGTDQAVGDSLESSTAKEKAPPHFLPSTPAERAVDPATPQRPVPQFPGPSPAAVARLVNDRNPFWVPRVTVPEVSQVMQCALASQYWSKRLKTADDYMLAYNTLKNTLPWKEVHRG
jgi:hypothetical protein